MSVKRHLLILLVLTVLIRGVMFISYPMGGQDEAQGNQRYAVNRVQEGELQFGYLRYPPGYPLTIAPFALLGELFGRFDERIVLLAQIALSSLIPFLLYDIFRSRQSPKAAFIISLVSLIDPFGLQWAHFSLPVWLVALCLVGTLWLLHHAERRRDWRLLILAGLVAGWGVLGRWNFAALVAGMGAIVFFISTGRLIHRLLRLITFGISCLLIIFIMHLTIQVPSTGVWNLNCLSGFTLVEGLLASKVAIRANNGPNSARLLALTTLPPLPHNLREVGYGGTYRIFFADNFPNWVNPGPWSTPEDRAAFLSQTPAEITEMSDYSNVQAMTWIYYYLGPCEANDLMQDVYFETAIAAPLRVISQIPRIATKMLWPPLQMVTNDTDYYYYSLPPSDTIEFTRVGGVLGFERAMRQDFFFYNGHWVWRPGIEIFSHIWAPLGLMRALVFPALIWAIFTRNRIYTVTAFLLVLYLIVVSLIVWPQQRIYAIAYPLGPVLVGGFLLAVWEKLTAVVQRTSAARR